MNYLCSTFVLINFIQNEFCQDEMTFPCPSKEDFEVMDKNQDGNLTIEEYSSFIEVK